MNLIKSILTGIVFMVTFIIIMAAQYITLSIVTISGGDESIERIHLFPEENYKVTYSDAVGFWGTSVSQSMDQGEMGPEYAIRGWIDREFWYNNMAWADFLWTQAKAVIVPVVVPVYEIRQMYTYYGAEIEDFIIEPESGSLLTGDEIAKNSAIETSLIYGLDVLNRDDYQYVYNIMRRIEKYNRTDLEGTEYYREFVEKFINYEGDLDNDFEVISVNSIAVFLFYQLFVALILALYFTYQNPISVQRNDMNENEVQGRILPRLPKVGLGKRKK